MSTGTYSLKVSGDAATVLAFKRLGFKARDLSAAFAQVSSEVAGDARALAPKVSGRLAGDVRPSTAKTKASVFVGRASVPYAGPINYGWPHRNIAASLFMNRAADTKADSAAVTVAREMDRLIRSVGLS